MQRRDLIFILVVVAVVGLLYYLSTTATSRSRRIPRDEVHLGIKAESQCLECHALPAATAMPPTSNDSGQGTRPSPASVRTLPKEHPNKVQCFRCHIYEKKK